MDQTPAHEHHNPDLLRMIPAQAQRIIEVGCSSGALAREFKKAAPTCDYLGIEIDEAFAALARRHCDRVLTLDIETADDAFWVSMADRDCWVLGDVLEHLKDPWGVLKKIRVIIPANGTLAVCLPNAQHWSVQARLAAGAFEYEEQGLLDKTHLRWFTRQTIETMFADTGFTIAEVIPRVFDEPQRGAFIPAIALMAKAAGVDPQQAVNDALPTQYVIRAVPNLKI